jgi:hypothetical protein
MTSDKAPREIRPGGRLVSRFTQGMVTDIKPPDLETRGHSRSAVGPRPLPSNEVAP